MAQRLLPRIPANSLLMADRNFGVFGFVHAAVAAGHDVLVRLVQGRFEALKRSAEDAGPGRWRLRWTPTKANRRTDPGLPADAEVSVWPHEFVGFSGQTLWVATTSGAGVEDL